MTDYTDLIQRLRKRAEIRRSIPRGEPDRIADQLEEAAAAIEQMNEDYRALYASYQHMQEEYGRQIEGLRERAERAEAERDALRELLNCYNLGGWTDAERLMKERDALKRALQLLRVALTADENEYDYNDWLDIIDTALKP